MQIIASTAPAAPNKWPVFPFVELTITFVLFPSIVFIAFVSIESFRCVDVPCAFI